MKKITIVLLLVLMLVPTLSLFGQERANRNAVSMDPILIIINYWAFSYERALTDQISVKGSVAYSPNLAWVSEISYLDLTAEGRYYWGSHLKDFAKDLPFGQDVTGKIFAEAISGLYAGVFGGTVSATGKNLNSSDGLFDASFFGLGGGITLGCKYVFVGDTFEFFGEPFAGLRYYTTVGGAGGWTYSDTSGTPITKPGDFDDGFTRTGAFGGINFGLTF